MRSLKRFILFLSGATLFTLAVYILRGRHIVQNERVIDHLPERSRQGLPFGPQPLQIFEPEDVSVEMKESQVNRFKYDTNQSKTLDADRSLQHLLDYVNFPARKSPFNFSNCQMLNCFDYSNCRTTGPLKIHIVESNIKRQSNQAVEGENNVIHKNILSILKSSDYYEADRDRACLFILEDDTLDRDPLSESFQNLPNDLFSLKQRFGMNYLVLNLFSGTWPDYLPDDQAGLQIGAAILAKASSSVSHHRANFDIALPLFSSAHPINDLDRPKSLKQNVDAPRPFFLTFKGKRYVIGSGSETRNSLYHIDNGRDVIMLSTCRHGKSWQGSADSRCSLDSANYDKHDFVDLMKNSTFCLVPRGRRLGSFRFLEALSYGCIPVVLSDGWIMPFSEIIDWSSATLRFKESLVLLVPDKLRDIDQKSIKKLRHNCLNIYEKYFSSVQRIIMTTLDIIQKRISSYNPD